MIKWGDVYVHWSTSNFDILRSEGMVYTYKGLDNAFAALKQSFDPDKWKYNFPTPVFFDFSSIDFLTKRTRSDFFSSEQEMINLGLINHGVQNEKLIESSIAERARGANKQGWAAKYHAVYDEVEYVVFNKYIESSMIIDGEQKKAIIRSFIDSSKAEIERRETEMKLFMDIDKWVLSSRYIKDETRDQKSQRSRIKSDIEKKLSFEQIYDELQPFWRSAQRLTQSVRILSPYSELPDNYFTLFLKYADFERDRIVDFLKFPTVFLKLRF